MSNKRNAALEALGAAPKPVVLSSVRSETDAPAPRKSAKTVAKVMLYMHPKVARKFKEIAFTEDRKANDIYLDALDAFLTQQGHGGIKGVVGR